MAEFVSQDYGKQGIYRGQIVEDLGECKYRVYIPGVHKHPPDFSSTSSTSLPTSEETATTDTEDNSVSEDSTHGDNKDNATSEDSSTTETADDSATVVAPSTSTNGLNNDDYPIANYVGWAGYFKLKPEEAVWVVFENGDINRPVLLGQFANLLPDAGTLVGSGQYIAPTATTPSSTPSSTSNPEDENFNGAGWDESNVTASCRDINELEPSAQAALKLWLERCKAANLPVLITETYRSQARQDYLYEQGRSRPGNIVTSTRNSKHTGRRAWDICKNVKGQEYSDDSFFAACGAIATELGIEWGGNWTGFVDKPHFQVPPGWTAP